MNIESIGKRAVNLTLMIAAILAVITTFSPLGQHQPLLLITRLLSQIVPAINKVSSLSGESSRSTLAIQWLFAPVYFLSIAAAAHGKLFPMIKTSGERSRIAKKSILGLVPVAICLSMILGDFGMGIGPSFFQGTVWDSTVPLPWARLPYEGQLGLLISAVLSPIAENCAYWFVIAWACQVAAVMGANQALQPIHAKKSAWSAELRRWAERLTRGR